MGEAGLSVLAAFGVAVVVIVTPGQDTALTIRNVLLAGRRGGIFTTLGVCSGQATWAIVTAAGLSALLVAFQPGFTAFCLAGAIYLLILGLRALVDAVKGTGDSTVAPGIGGRVLSPASAFRQGMLSNLANPKMLVFFASLLPQFAQSAPLLLGYGLVFCAMTMTWLAGYSLVVAKLGDVLRRGRVRRALDALTGTVLVAFGLRLAVEPA